MEWMTKKHSALYSCSLAVPQKVYDRAIRHIPINGRGATMATDANSTVVEKLQSTFSHS